MNLRTTGSLPIREVRGNLRFPLDKTYHGCPRIMPNPVWGVITVKLKKVKGRLKTDGQMLTDHARKVSGKRYASA